MSKNKTKFKEGPRSENRARQFIPFMALKGYFEMCHAVENAPKPRHVLTEEEQTALSLAIRSLHECDMVKVVHYVKETYVETKGLVSEVVPELRYLRVVRTRIRFDDILSIERLDI